jgi:hypothetical protein
MHLFGHRLLEIVEEHQRDDDERNPSSRGLPAGIEPAPPSAFSEIVEACADEPPEKESHIQACSPEGRQWVVSQRA